MSYTEIFKFRKDGNAEAIGETKNAFRSAMAVWDILDKKYLPKFVPEWAKRIGEVDKEYFRSSDFGGGGLKEVWDLFNKENVSETDKIALGSTFDKVIVLKEDLPKLIEAFKSFEGETSLKDQVVIIEEALVEDPELLGIAWNQTSVNGDCWTNFGGYDEEKQEEIPYNILTMDEHWNLFEEE